MVTATSPSAPNSLSELKIKWHWHWLTGEGCKPFILMSFYLNMPWLVMVVEFDVFATQLTVPWWNSLCNMEVHYTGEEGWGATKYFRL